MGDGHRSKILGRRCGTQEEEEEERRGIFGLTNILALGEG